IVNSAAKMLYMSGGQSSVPMVIRGPGGSAHQLAAQHSQALEAWFCHVPGLKVVMPSTPADAKGLLKSAVRGNNTVISLESEALNRSVKKTNRAVIVEAGWPFCGVGAQMVDTIQHHAFDYLDAPNLRVTGADVPMPYAKNLEHLCLPDKARVVEAVHRVL